MPNVQRGNRFLDLSWTPSPNNGDPVIEYQVRMESNPNTWVPVGAGTAYRWSDLPNGVAQRFQVRSRNRDPDWSVASGWSAAVKPCAVPDQPAAPSAARGDGRAVVTYTAPGDQGCAISQIQIEASGGATQTATASPHTFTGLSNGTSYTFRVRAQNEEGWGAWSAASNAVTPAGVPQGPTSISTANSGVGEVTATWPAAAPNGAPLLRYEISINNGGAQDVGLTTSVHARRPVAEHGRTRSRSAPATTWSCGAWSPNSVDHHVGRARPARRAERLGRRRHDLRHRGRTRPPTADRSTTTKSSTTAAATRTWEATPRRGTPPTARATRSASGRATSSAARRGARGASR